MQQNIDVLRARLDEIETEFRSIDTGGERALDEAEQVRWDELDAELKQLRQELSDAEAAQSAPTGWPSPAPSGAAFRSRRPAWTRSPTSTSSTAWPMTTRR